ncbi:MAG TPA: hypothetical protein VGQ37_09765 [Vicinamibacterales bacterium]|jgi:hypothetical protein|nr:hypothetical protein [Vicinamibacterales bacterium]
MRGRTFITLGAAGLAVLAWASGSAAQRGGTFQGSMEDPAIAYTKAPVSNVVADLNARLADGTLQLRFDGRAGYLQSALDALNLSIDSQLLLFSQTSLQAARIGPANPRALFFNDRAALGWVRDGDVIEVAAHDAAQGIVFYTLDQKPVVAGGPPQFKRAFVCLGCHVTSDTLGVPGLLNFSTTESGPGSLMRAVAMNQGTPLAARWGGWLVTGATGGAAHRGNELPALDPARRRDLRSVDGLFEPDGYRAATSDVGALLVFSHQTQMMNLLTRIGWEARAADPQLHPAAASSPDAEQRVAEMMRGIAAEVVDYMLFIDEAALPGGVQASAGFASRFAAVGPRDARGRSLHELDLTRRLLKYPCSYLIYSPAFDALPPSAKAPVFRRLWEVLSGGDRGERYRRALSREDRQAIVEILRDTKKDLPDYFAGQVG